jgi:hypothetical protein
MKNSITLLLASCFLFLTTAQAQLSTPSWSGKFEPSKAFVENKGQFEQRLKNPDSKDTCMQPIRVRCKSIFQSKRADLQI